MKKKGVFFVAMFGFLLFACARYSVKTTYDEFQKTTTNQMVGNILPGHGPGLPVLALNVHRCQSKEGVTYRLALYYVYDRWLFIRSGESLVFLIDGQRIGLTGPGSLNQRSFHGLGQLSELALYPISLENLKRIANGKEVKVRIIGQSTFLDKKISEKNLQNFRKFVSEYCRK